MLDVAKSDVSSEDNDQETSWLITSEYIEDINTHRYYAYQIVYSYINKSILSKEQKEESSRIVLIHLSNLARKMMRSMRKTEIKILSLAKFTAAIDVGMWSNDPDFKTPEKYYKDYEDLMEEPKTFFSYHEPNIQKFFDLELLLQVFPLKG